MSITIDQFEVLESIVETGSFRAAAKKLNKSQPSLSLAIKKIEELYEIKIFSRDKYRPSLTAEGEMLFSSTQEILNSYRKAISLVKELKLGTEPRIKIIIDPIIRVSKIANILNSLIHTKKNIVLDLVTSPIDLEGEVILNSDADLCVSYFPINSPTIECQVLKTVKLVPVIRTKLFNSSMSTQELLESTPQILVKENDLGNVQTPNFYSKSWFVSNYSLKEELIMEGFGWGLLPEGVYLREKEFLGRELSILSDLNFPDYDLKLYIVKSKKAVMGPIITEIWSSSQPLTGK